MRQAVASALLVICFTPQMSALQSRGGTGAGSPANRACSLLTKERVLKTTPYKDTSFLFLIEPNGDILGTSGSACEYGAIGLQIDPFTPARLEELRQKSGKDWVAVSGVGDGAYFRANGTTYAELYVRVGTHTMTIPDERPHWYNARGHEAERHRVGQYPRAGAPVRSILSPSPLSY